MLQPSEYSCPSFSATFLFSFEIIFYYKLWRSLLFCTTLECCDFGVNILILTIPSSSIFERFITELWWCLISKCRLSACEFLSPLLNRVQHCCLVLHVLLINSDIISLVQSDLDFCSDQSYYCFTYLLTNFLHK